MNYKSLWGRVYFKKLPPNTKLLFLYLTSNVNISILGITSIQDIDIIVKDTGLSLNNIRDSTKELIDNEFIKVMTHNKVIYFINLKVLNSVSSNLQKRNSILIELESLPEKIQNFIKSYTNNFYKGDINNFWKEPTEKEVEKYFNSYGYKVNPSEFISFYRDSSEKFFVTDGWVDSRGKPIKDWKAKARKVWFKKADRISKPPEGVDSFFIYDKGLKIYPEKWIDGKPYSSSPVIDRKLKTEYEKRLHREGEGI